MRWLAPRLASGSLDELSAVSHFQPVSILLKDRDRKAVVVEKAKPSQPLMVFDIAPVVEKPLVVLWAALSDRPIGETASAYANGFLNCVNDTYPEILTHVDARNVRHIAFLENVGFTRTGELPNHGRKQLKFYAYTRTGSAANV